MTVALWATEGALRKGSPIKTILFDINETVLDLDGLRALFNSQFKGAITVEHWFTALLHSSTIAALTDVETTFAKLAKITLTKLVQSQNKQPAIERREIRGNLVIEENEEFVTEALEKIANLNAHDDIIPALILLKENGYKTVAFSNSSSTLIQSQIKNAGLEGHFDEIISVESTGSFKPHEKVYRFAAVKLAEPIENLRLIACHDWDTHGALTAGMKAAYLDRSQTPYNPLYQKTDIKGNTMIEIAKRIIEINEQRAQKR
ncbi:MAG: HAD family hydrolase [Rhodomicrobiaceae bacterium]